uniref:Hexosyltransferase n=1 Tax=Strongyloides papillosus TaxID=174720 RepID=A0A0N5CFS8_STREA
MLKMKAKRNFAILLVVGFILGLWIRSTRWITLQQLNINSLSCLSFTDNNNFLTTNSTFDNEKSTQLLLVGVMTAQKYVNTRAYNIWKTWGQKVPGKIIFFVAEDTVVDYPDMPVVKLKGVDDTYPPQKKSFSMIRWMYDNHLNDFHWFMRADDDLYVRHEEIEKLLRSLDSSKAYMLGQAGLGNSAEYGLLALGSQDNYCMGGPGVVFSRESIRAVAPHLQSCLLNLLTGHEDVELGRCFKRHVGIPCTWSYEMQILFHNNQTATNTISGELKQLRSAITLHPLKNPTNMRKVHIKALTLQLNELRAKRIALKNVLNKELTEHRNVLNRKVNNNTYDLKEWDYLASNSILFCANKVMCPRHTVEHTMKSSLESTISQLFDEFNSNARQRGRFLQFENIQYGYTRLEERFGVDYILDMILWFKKFRLPHRATLSVRRHAYVQQQFGDIEGISEKKARIFDIKKAGNFAKNKNERVGMDLNLPGTSYVYPPKTIHIVLPLSGRSSTLRRFAENLKNTVKKGDVILNIVRYDSKNSTEDKIISDILDNLKDTIDVNEIEMGNRNFSRGVALTIGANELSDDSLIFFSDVDMVFDQNTLHRVRMNTIRGAQVYFPIVFSQFSPQTWSKRDISYNANINNTNHYVYDNHRGYFRHFGYGLVSIYKSDFDLIGGYNLTIKGWGIEDVDFFSKVINSTLRVMRAPDPGLVHVYHDVNCSGDMPKQQYHMCLGSKAASLASLDYLIEKIEKI